MSLSSGEGGGEQQQHSADGQRWRRVTDVLVTETVPAGADLGVDADLPAAAHLIVLGDLRTVTVHVGLAVLCGDTQTTR